MKRKNPRHRMKADGTRETNAEAKSRVAIRGPAPNRVKKKHSPGARSLVRRLRFVSENMMFELSKSHETPLDVMLKNMLFYHRHCEEIAVKLRDMIVNVDNEDERREAFKMLREMLAAREMAQQCAVDAAPYCHARFASIEFTPPPPEVKDEEMPQDPVEASIVYQRLIGGNK